LIIFQSLCWAAANKGLGAWVTDSQRNFVLGLFGTCPFAGGILGTALAVRNCSIEFDCIQFFINRFIFKEKMVGVLFIFNHRCIVYVNISIV
jgi:sugar phosphate permease